MQCARRCPSAWRVDDDFRPCPWRRRCGRPARRRRLHAAARASGLCRRHRSGEFGPAGRRQSRIGARRRWASRRSPASSTRANGIMSSRDTRNFAFNNPKAHEQTDAAHPLRRGGQRHCGRPDRAWSRSRRSIPRARRPRRSAASAASSRICSAISARSARRARRRARRPRDGAAARNARLSLADRLFACRSVALRDSFPPHAGFIRCE